MICKAILDLKERNGSSRSAIKKYLAANYTLPENFGVTFNLQLKKLVAKGVLVQPKGPSGTVKISPEEKEKLKVNIRHTHSLLDLPSPLS